MYYAHYKDNIRFEYCQQLPINRHAFPVNKMALHGYALYRNAIANGYRNNPDLAQDICDFEPLYDDSRDGLHHYASNAALGAMQDWQNPDQNMASYIAYDGDCMVGFVQFQEKTVDGKGCVYIANLAVEQPNQGIGTRLMQSVLSHYCAETEFRLGTRVFNTQAIHLYQNKFKFTPLTAQEVTALGLDERYCGFRHTTGVDEVLAIKAQQVTHQPQASLVAPARPRS